MSNPATAISEVNVLRLIKDHTQPKLDSLEAEYRELLTKLIATSLEISKVKLHRDLAILDQGEKGDDKVL